MKGDVPIEFIMAVVIFVTSISFVLISVSSRLPLFEETAFYYDTISESYQISDLVMFTRGVPSNWEIDPYNADRVGLSSGRKYVISQSKLNALHNFCNDPSNGPENFLAFNDMFTEKGVLSVRVYRLNNLIAGISAPTWYCEGVIDASTTKFESERFAILDNPDKEIIKLEFLIQG